VLKTIETVAGTAVPFSFAPRRAGDPSRLFADAGRANNVLGWQPRYGLSDIVATALQWEKNRRY
jgi:UDP-glucose 4-epimerase